MSFKILVLDLDGTLTNSKKEITKKNREILLKAQKQGVVVVLASGRPTYGIAPLADALELDRFGGYVLAYNGGEIIDWRTKTLLYANVLPDDVLPSLHKSAAKNGLALLSYDGDHVLTEHPDDEYVAKEAFINKMKIKGTTDFLTDVPRPVPKCLIVGDPEKLIPVEAELSIDLQDIISVYRSEPYFLELVPMGIDKARSLAVLLEKLGMTREDMVAVGDGYNDLSMIQYAGMGVAMANAQEPVRKAADYVTLSNEEDGVAAVVEKFFLKN